MNDEGLDDEEKDDECEGVVDNSLFYFISKSPLMDKRSVQL
jgi:hypothetical protein